MSKKHLTLNDRIIIQSGPQQHLTLAMICDTFRNQGPVSDTTLYPDQTLPQMDSVIIHKGGQVILMVLFTNCDLQLMFLRYEIIPQEPYTEADLD